MPQVRPNEGRAEALQYAMSDLMAGHRTTMPTRSWLSAKEDGNEER